MNKMTKVLALVLALLMVVPALAACKDNPSDHTEAPTQDPNTSGTPVTDPPQPTGEFTYNLRLDGEPDNWNPHAWEMNSDSALMSYIEMPIVDVSIAEDGFSYEWVYEMATAVTDITSQYAADAALAEKWLGANADGSYPTEGYVYELKLNEDAKWQDGTPINADTYIYSMQQCINPEMKNYRANNYLTGDSAVKNAQAYYNNDLVGQPLYGDLIADRSEDDVYTYNALYTEGTTLYFNPEAGSFFFGGESIKYYIDAGYAGSYPTLDTFTPYIGQGYVEVDDELIALLEAAALEFGDTLEGAWQEFCFIVVGEYEETPWEDVGLFKVDDYTVIYVCENPITMFYFLTSLTSNWIVYEDLYEEGKKQTGDLVTTKYGTEKDFYMASGPYQIETLEKSKQIVLVRNENWYGWTDGKHEGQFQTTKVVMDVVLEHATALMMFEKGELDEITLTADDLNTYRMSEYLLKTLMTYNMRFIFATDLEKLTALEAEAGDGANKKVLYYDDFRKAISLSLNRTEFCQLGTSGYVPSYYLLNDLYYYDAEHNPESIYRYTTDAKEAVLRLYGIEYGPGQTYATVDEAYESVTGYDVEEARQLFQAVYQQAIEDGNYTEGQDIKINCYATGAASLSADDQKQQELLNDYVTAATVGTGFEGKISFTFYGGISTRYADVANGRIEMIRGAWGGAAFYPFSVIRCYTEPEYMGGLEAIHESCGWDPTVETLAIEVNGETITKTFQNWAKSINPGGEYDGDADICMTILSNLESGVLAAYQCIPFGSEVDCSLSSKQIKYATTEYNIMYGYGGVRLMTYEYNDAEWAEYVASQPDGIIDYK